MVVDEDKSSHSNQNGLDNHDDAESELSEPGTPPSPPRFSRSMNRHADNEATEDEAEPTSQGSPRATRAPYGSKRKRTATFTREPVNYATLATEGLDAAREMAATRPKSRGRAPRLTPNASKGVTIGYWRHSPVPEKERKHAVIGFIDVRDRLRTRIRLDNLLGEHISNVWPLPAKTGASWVTFDGICFLPHLVGLDQVQVKEYVRIRADAPEEKDPEVKLAAQKQAVQEAIQVVRKNGIVDPSAPFQPQYQIAYGEEAPEPMAKRRRVTGDFTAASTADNQHQTVQEDLSGSRPTRIFLGTWNKSDAVDPANRHAVYGILGANDMFRVKLVRETRDGSFRDGNFPQGPGALWISYDEVDLDPHLKSLTRAEIKEYCRVRQHQIDLGEKPEDRIGNETTAVFEAQKRVPGPRSFFANQAAEAEAVGDVTATPERPATSNGPKTSAGQELRTSRRVEARQQQQQQAQLEEIQREQERLAHERATQLSRPQTQENNASQTPNGNSFGALQRTTALAQREIGRAEATQGRADLHATHRERAVAAAEAAAREASLAAAASSPNTRRSLSSRLFETEDMRRLNNVWARQESMRARNGGEDAKIYDGVKYERKTTGPLMGKLVSHGSLINIDGEDYVEYRVLTKPSFF